MAWGGWRRLLITLPVSPEQGAQGLAEQEQTVTERRGGAHWWGERVPLPLGLTQRPGLDIPRTGVAGSRPRSRGLGMGGEHRDG